MATQINLQDRMQSEVSQARKDKHRVILEWNLKMMTLWKQRGRGRQSSELETG